MGLQKNNLCLFINVLAWFSLYLTSCQIKRPTEFRDKASLEQYVYDHDNGLEKSTTTANGIKMAVCSYPNALIWSDIRSAEKPVENTVYFTLRLSYDDKELLNQLPSEMYGTYIQLFSFRLHNYIYVKTRQGHKIQPTSILFQPTYNLSNANIALVAFNANDIMEDKYIDFVVDDFGLKTGRVEFTFDSEIIRYSTKVNIL